MAGKWDRTEGTFFLFSGPELGSGLESKGPADEGKARFERVSGI